jgi:hypothetical protein
VNLSLGDARLSATLTDGNDLSGWVRVGENLDRNEIIGENDVGGLEQTKRAEGEKARIPGACASEIDSAGL